VDVTPQPTSAATKGTATEIRGRNLLGTAISLRPNRRGVIAARNPARTCVLMRRGVSRSRNQEPLRADQRLIRRVLVVPLRTPKPDPAAGARKFGIEREAELQRQNRPRVRR